jgi:PucR C-terminal helix-turn-helix domain
VKDLEVRLDALDPDAGAAVRVIGYFDRLTEAGGGLEAIVRGAAVLTGCPARLTDEARRLSLRVEPDGSQGGPGAPPDPSWLNANVGPAGDGTGGAVLWLERPGPAGPVEAMVLERAGAAARVVLVRTRGRAPARTGDDAAAAEVLVDAGAPPEARRHAAHVLGLTGVSLVRAVALARGAVIEPVIWAEPGSKADGESVPPAPDGPRSGIGQAVSLDGVPESWATARTALRLTAEGTADDPGPRSVRYDELGGLAVLARSVGPATPVIADELRLEHAAVAAPWMLATLHAVATSASLRGAAAALLVHHSTLQERIEHAERLLGWTIRKPDGRQRLYLALVLRRLRRHPPGP